MIRRFLDSQPTQASKPGTAFFTVAICLMLALTGVAGATPIDLSQTGQTGCWNAGGNSIDCTGTGQDAAKLSGAAWPAMRFTDNNDGTITDSLTGLVWLKDANCFGAQTWDSALSSANNLANGACGLTDGSTAGQWRLPSVNEIQSITNAQQTNVATWLNSQGFSNVQLFKYWSSTTLKLNLAGAWVVIMDSSNATYVSTANKTYNNYVLPVRGAASASARIWKTGQTDCYDSSGNSIACAGTGQDGELQSGVAWPSPRFTDNGNGTVTDNLTGLIWLKKANCFGTKDWTTALSSANSLANNSCELTDGSSSGDWRLPNREELYSLLDFGFSSPALSNGAGTAKWASGDIFSNVVSNSAGRYWSSTTDTASDVKRAWAVTMYYGEVYSWVKTNLFYVWPVRGGRLFGNPAFSTSPSPHDFGIVNPGSSSSAQTFTITNTGNNNLFLNTITKSGTNTGEFSIQSDTCSNIMIAPSGTCTVDVVFSPTTGGPKSAGLSIPSNAPASPTAVNLSGTGLQHTISTSVSAGSGNIICTPNPVDHGSTSSCSITPSTGYHITSISGCGGVDPEVQTYNAGYSYSTGQINVECTVTANFAANQRVLTVNKTGNGSGSVTGSGTYAYGSGNEITAAASQGTTFTGWSGDCSGSSSPYRVTMLDRDMACTATFTLNTHTLMVNTAGTGSGTTGGGGTYDYGTNHNVTASANTGSTFTVWSGDCSGSSGTYSVTMPDSDVLCTANFDINSYTITTGAGDNGSISCTPTTVTYNSSSSCTISALTGYHITDVSVGPTGGSLGPVGAVTYYTISNVGADMTIAATFGINTYHISGWASGGHGTISCSPDIVNYGGSSVCTITPDLGYHLSSLTDNGSPVSGYLVTNTYTFTNITADHTNIVATFAKGRWAVDLPQTGQTTIYAAGDDGDIRAGVSWTDPRFTVNLAAPDSGGSMTDNLTGLVWAADGGTPAAGECTGGIKTWQEGLDYIACLNSVNYLGHTDWRLPNRNEIQSILDAQSPDMTAWLDSNGFMNVSSDCYWSSTTSASVTGIVWCFSISDGGMYGVTEADNYLHVWPVRGDSGTDGSIITLPKTGQASVVASGDDADAGKGASWPVPRFTDNGDGTVIDNLSGLIWLKSANCTDTVGGVSKAGGTLTWADAITWSNSLAGGKCGLIDGSTAGQWRLPNRFELASLLDLSQSGPSLPQDMPFADVQLTDGYWASTTSAVDTTKGLIIDMAEGSVSAAEKTGSGYVWPVKAGLYGDVSVTPLSKSFAETSISARSAAQTFTITNIGTGVLTIGSISFTGTNPTEFTKQNDGCSNNSLSPAGSCTLQALFSPSSTGSKNGFLTVPTDDPSNGLVNISLSGTAMNTFTVTPSVVGSGTISPAVAQTVSYNDTISFTVSALTGSHLVSVTGCNGSLSDSLYTTGQITDNCTVTATFAPDSYTITTSVPGAHGTITCVPASVNYDGGTSCIVTPDSGYHLSFLTDNSLDVTATVSGGSYGLSHVTSNHALSATFQFSLVKKTTGGTTTYFSDLQSALNAAMTGDVFKLQSGITSGNIIIGTNTAVTLKGGYDATFNSRSGTTTISGSLTISKGTVTIDGIEIR